MQLTKNISVEVVRGGVLDVPALGIVNAANREMRGGSGVNGAVNKAAGPELLEYLIRTVPDRVDVGKVVVTPPFDLQQRGIKNIFHVAGPIYSDYTPEQAEALLFSAYLNVLYVANCNLSDLGRLNSWASLDAPSGTLGVCSLSTGIYGFPLKRASEIAMQACVRHAQDFPTAKMEIKFCMFGEEEFNVFSESLKQIQKPRFSILNFFKSLGSGK